MYIVITGTSRGIGAALTKKALSLGHHVLAVARNPEDSEDLNQLKTNSNLQLLKIDLTRSEAENEISAAVKGWPCVDVVINNAGVLLENERLADYELSFLTNAIMPLFVTRALLLKLKKSSYPLSFQITSQMGSIADNSSGGYYSYRASKAALNMLFKSLAVDEPWLKVLQVHPGWVKTRMGGAGAPTPPEESVEGIWSLIEKAKKLTSGSFHDFRGRELPW